MLDRRCCGNYLLEHGSCVIGHDSHLVTCFSNGPGNNAFCAIERTGERKLSVIGLRGDMWPVGRGVLVSSVITVVIYCFIFKTLNGILETLFNKREQGSFHHSHWTSLGRSALATVHLRLAPGEYDKWLYP